MKWKYTVRNEKIGRAWPLETQADERAVGLGFLA